MSDRPLVVILGPTGSGKSDLALRIAETFNGEIVNSDSLQLYRYLDVGTAKTPPSERRGIPHHLIDILEPAEVFTAGEYARRARPILSEIADCGRLPIVVGGTGFYVRALLEGLMPAPAANDALRRRLNAREERHPGSLHRILRRFDGAAAQRIHANDRKKLIRALELCLSARRPVSELHRMSRDRLTGFGPIKLGLDPPREALYTRLDERSRQIFEHGIVEEVRGILARGIPACAKALESIGYKEALRVIAGDLTPSEAVELTQRNTRRYAKRQMTWFRRESGVFWLGGFGSDTDVQDSALAHLDKNLPRALTL